jgi:hypothetical protein
MNDLVIRRTSNDQLLHDIVIWGNEIIGDGCCLRVKLDGATVAILYLFNATTEIQDNQNDTSK